MSAPLSRVLSAAEQGATTREEIARRTGLDPILVDACVDHLVRIGLVASPSLQIGCAGNGCLGCAAFTGCSSRRRAS